MNKVLQSQKKAHTFVSNVLDTFMASKQTILPHFLLSGSTGTGKTMLIKLLAKKYGLRVLDINGAQLTPEGLQGASLSRVLVPLKKVTNTPVIVLVDEFDKVFDKSVDKTVVQQELLHIISSQRATVLGEYGKYDIIKTHKVLWVFAGAFSNRENVSPEELLTLGMEPELLGRVNLHTHIPDVEMDEILNAVDTDELLAQYAEVKALTDKEEKAAIHAIKQRIKEIWSQSVIGYRVIQRVIHQYFLYNGEFPPESDTDIDLDEIGESLDGNDL